MSYRKEHAIVKGVSDFSDMMCNRMWDKMDQGYEGWNDPAIDRVLIQDKLAEKVLIHNKTTKDLVDIANFAMILWKTNPNF